MAARLPTRTPPIAGRADFAPRIAAIKQRVRLSDLIGAGVALRRRGRIHVGLCPFHAERTPSFTIHDQRGFYHCFGCGAHGDAIDWLRHRDGLDFAAALDRLDGGHHPLPPRQMPAPHPATPADEESLAWARSLWAAGLPACGTVVETYLQARGIELPLPEALRFAPALPESDTARCYPAMLAAIVDGGGDLIGVHRTYLRPDGRGKAAVPAAKKVAGRVAGGSIRLAQAGPAIGLAEGIETALSVMQATGLPCWSVVSLGNLAGPGGTARYPVPHPQRPGVSLPSIEPDLDRPGIVLPDVVRAVELYADADSRDPLTAERLVRRGARRFERRGLAVRIVRPPAGLDFNDVLVGGERGSPVRR
ncbi:MAG: hypothetical protein KIS72_07490 [Luteimonas sp.]|nr:hypothetical protein [Luteimonas sp.]